MAGFPKAGDVYGGRYRIVRHLGHGGMGSVYEAVDTVLERPVALKIVLPSLTDREDYQARFAREASVLARIRSRHIVGIHEYGEDEDTVYFVTELFPDGDLQSWLVRHGPLERRQALSLAAQVCEALADAHAAGVIHRDVKPGNVLLWRRHEGLIPYLCDFGIALDGQQGLTRTGTLVGSPAYMAPERHFGHPADERGDLYSVGCLLWAALTGDAPYSGTDFQVMNSHINEPVPQLRTSNPLDRRIDEVLAASMHKDPDRRIGSAAEMRQALLTILAESDGRPAPTVAPPVAPAREAEQPPGPAAPGPSTVVRPTPTPPGPTPPAAPPTGERLAATGDATPPLGRRRGLWAVAAVVVLVVLGGTAWAIGAGSDDDASPVAEEPTTTVDSPSPDPSDTPAPPPPPPRVAAEPGYRSVVFTVTPPAARSGERVEYRRGDSWRRATRRVSVPTERGGERACLIARTAAVDGGEPSRTVRTCGRAEAATVRFIRNTDDACVNSVGGPCTWYDVAVTGFPSSASPLVEVRRPDGASFCGGPCDFDRIRVGKDGRGYLPRDWKISRDEGVVILDVAGVTGRFRLYH
jgi:serine/threonine protein kinase